MDMSQSIEPRSDQLNADDLIAGPITVKIMAVTSGTAEQPVNVELEEYPGRPFKPSKSMRRVLVAAWGRDSGAYIGQQLTLYRDPEVTFGREKVGGIRISHMTGITAPLTVPLTVTRGKRRQFTVQPLTLATATTLDDVASATSEAELRAMWDTATDEVRAAIRQRVTDLRGGDAA